MISLFELLIIGLLANAAGNHRKDMSAELKVSWWLTPHPGDQGNPEGGQSDSGAHHQGLGVVGGGPFVHSTAEETESTEVTPCTYPPPLLFSLLLPPVCLFICLPLSPSM